MTMGSSRPSFGQRMLPTLVGAIDASVVWAYPIGIPPTLWHMLTLGLKLSIVLVMWREIRTPVPLAWLWISSVLLMIAASTLSGPVSLQPYVQAAGFSMHALVSLALIDATRLRRYLIGAVYALSSAIAVHIALTAAGMMQSNYGRFYFFGRNHPILGGEMAAILAIAAAIVCRGRVAVAVLALAAIEVLVVQARSATLVIAAVIAVVTVSWLARNTRGQTHLRVLATIAVVLFAIVLPIFGFGSDLVNSVLLLDDPNRGIGTGFTGRDQLWFYAMRLFGERPFSGHYLGYFSDIYYLGPHNVFLFGLAQHGLSSLPFFAILGVATWSIVLEHPKVGLKLLCLAPLWLFNDRMLNLNPFPMIIYVTILVLASQTLQRSGRQGATAAPSTYHARA